jgi:hypothetical protein
MRVKLAKSKPALEPVHRICGSATVTFCRRCHSGRAAGIPYLDEVACSGKAIIGLDECLKEPDVRFEVVFVMLPRRSCRRAWRDAEMSCVGHERSRTRTLDVPAGDRDDLLCSLGHGQLLTSEARRFWMELVGTQEAGMSMQDMEGYDELMKKLLATLSPEQRLAGLDPEQRLAGLDPEQRLAGLDRDHQALALPLEVLRLLPDEYLGSLSPEVHAEIHRRLTQNGH